MQTKKMSTGMLAGIAFLVGAILPLILGLINNLILRVSYGYYVGLSVLTWLSVFVMVFLGVTLLMNKKSILPVIAAGVVALIQLVYLISRFSIWNLILFLGWTLLALVLAAAILPQLKSLGESIKAFYFVPAILVGLVYLITFFLSFGEYLPPFYKIIGAFGSLFRLAGFAAGAFFAAKWAFEDETAAAPVRSADGAAQPMNGAAQPVGAPAAVPTEEEGFISMGKHVLLLLLTCGIWMYIWIYRTTAYTNRVQDEEQRDPTKKLLLCLFVPFYSIYWTYKTAQRVDKLSVQKGLPGDSATLMLILALFIGIVPPIMLQDKINKIATTPGGGMPRMAQPYQPAPNQPAPQPYQPAPQPYQPAPQPPVPDASEALRNFKSLLDDGVITEEEFEAKKKQLLGL